MNNAERLRNTRRDLGYSLDNLEELSGITGGTLSKIENGVVANPGLSTWRALYDVFGADDVDARWWFTGREKAEEE